jgi:hypothetical protein
MEGTRRARLIDFLGYGHSSLNAPIAEGDMARHHGRGMVSAPERVRLARR